MGAKPKILVTSASGKTGLATARQLRDCSLVPSKDPRLSESLALDNA